MAPPPRNSPSVVTYTSLRAEEGPTKIVRSGEVVSVTSKDLPTVKLEEPLESTVKRDPLIGAMLDQYQVTGRLGEGGMGVVYRAVQPMIGKEVAIKLLKPGAEDDEVAVKRLLEEARAVNAIRHRGIIDIFGFGKLDSGQQYVVMELLHGRPLDALIEQRGKLPLSEAAPILDEILSALFAAHTAGVIHRDLKPNNIFLVELPGQPAFVKILDFGLVKRTGATGEGLTRVNMTVGTPQYIAPEQACGQPVSAASDLYAVGVIAFELLSGTLPFDEPTPMDWLRAHVNKPPLRLGDVVEVPPAIDAWVARLLSKALEERFANAGDARTQLAQAAKAQPAVDTGAVTQPTKAPLKARASAPRAPKPASRPAPEPAPPPEATKTTRHEPTMEVQRVAPPRSRAPLIGALVGVVAILGIAVVVLKPGPEVAEPATELPLPADPIPTPAQKPEPVAVTPEPTPVVPEPAPVVPAPKPVAKPVTRPVAPAPSKLEQERTAVLARITTLQGDAKSAREGKPDELALGVLRSIETAARAAQTTDDVAAVRRKIAQYEKDWVKKR